MSLGKYFLGGGAISAALLMTVPAPARAQSALSSQVHSLQKQIQMLNQKLKDLQTEISQTQQKQEQTQATVAQIKATPAPTGVPFVKMHGISPTFSTPDGAYTMSITGRLHLDMGDYIHYSPKSGQTTKVLNGGIKARRARLGVHGKIDNVFGYAFIMDFGGSSADSSSPVIENGFVTYNGAAPFHFILGYQDTPYSMDEATSSNDIMFLERSSSQSIATGLAASDNRSALGAWWNNSRGWVGVYLTGPTSGTNYTKDAAQLGMTGRATYQVIQTAHDSFHIGIDGEDLFKPGHANGSTASLDLHDSPELRIDNASILDTGTISPVNGASVIGGEVAGNLGPLYGQGEFFHIMVDRRDASSLSFNGGYVEASYALTGEIKKYHAGSGAYGSISPAHPFSPSNGGWGAWEIAARYSVMDLNDQLGSPTGVAGGKQQTYTFGINWYPSSNLRFMLDYIHSKIDKQVSATNTTPAGATVDAIALREQFAF